MLFFRKHKKVSASITGLVLFCLVFSLISPVLLYPKKAQAIPVLVTTDIPKVISETWKKIENVVLDVVKIGIWQAFMSMLTNFLNRIAYDTAVSIATRGEGQMEQFHKKDWKDYMSDAGDMAAGDFIGAIGNRIGVDLCVPPIIGLNIALGIGRVQKPPKPKCTLMEMKSNWEESLQDPEFLKNYAVSFRPEQNELGTWFKLKSELGEVKVEEQAASKARRDGQWMKDKTGAVSKEIETPGILSQKAAEKTIVDQPYEVQKQDVPKDFKSSLGPIGGAFTAAGQLFMNTLAAEMLKNILTDGLFTLRSLGKDKSLNLPTAGGTTGGIKLAEQAFAPLLVPRMKGGGEYSILGEFSVCPPDRKAAGIYNCVINNSFAQAIQGKGESEYYSVQEAIDAGFLNPDTPFGWKDAQARPAQEPDYLDGYPYSSMLKLRRFRIIPLGWEIAAQRIAERGDFSNYTLQEVLDCFEDKAECKAEGEDSDQSIGSNNHNYLYHLVDPNWLLKAPAQNCKAIAYGQILNYGSNQRKEYCVDTKDCVVEAEDGSCLSWDYCTREENTWRFNGINCPAIYNTCQNYFRNIDGQEFSFLKNTLTGKNICDASNAGCQWSSKSKVGGSWDDNDRIYLNRNFKECDADAAGCTEFLQVLDDENEKLNAAKLAEAKDYVLAQPVDHNQSFSDVLKTKDEYKNYTTKSIHLNGQRTPCGQENVGCEKYTPVNNEPWVPGVVASSDSCPAECVGYNSYKQEKTFFEIPRYPVFFIPKDPKNPAKVCSSADAGCDQFTNLDEVARGGEGIEYYTYLRQCQKSAPVNNDCATYITWEGSDTQGYQIKTWSLKNSQSHNAPCTKINADTGACVDPALNSNNAVCDKEATRPGSTTYNPDCREFYDVDGNISYRLYTRTISCSDDCHPYRKTESDQISCQDTGGSWQDNKCVYLAIPGQGRTCGAAASGCREYKGEAANNVFKVLEYYFETADKIASDWSQGTQSSEAIHRDGHSLKTSANTAVSVVNKITKDETYKLEFWARGSGDLIIKFTNAGVNDRFSDTDTNTLAPKVALTSNWRPYTLGPVFVTWDLATGENLEFSGFSGDSYLDNVILKEVIDNPFLIKDSWTTPDSCATDPTLNLNIHPPPNSPGFYKGCQAYKDRANKTHNLYNFNKLCEEKYIGCEALIDTQNFTSPFSKTFNPLPPLKDNVTIGADDIAYLVNNREKYCMPSDKGCREVGTPIKGGNYESQYLRDNPDQYETILCTHPELGCEAYNYDSSTDYFKDPGEKVCYYLPIAETQPVTYAWFKEADKDTRLGSQANPAECQNAQNNDWAKNCPKEQSGCTEFIEPYYCEFRNSEWYKKNTDELCRRYYYLNNDRLDDSSCDGLVDWKKGCVLFNDTSDADLTYNSETSSGPQSISAAAADSNCGGQGEPACDSNLLLKVKRDRVCGEWLTCASSTRVWQEGQYKDICYRVARCRGEKSDNVTECKDFVPPDTGGVECLVDNDCGAGSCLQIGSRKFCSPSPKITNDIYQKRNTAWNALEYAGLSLYNRFPIEDLRQKSYGLDDSGNPSDFRLTYLIKAVPETSCRQDKDCLDANKGDTCWNNKCFEDRGIDDRSLAAVLENNNPIPCSSASDCNLGEVCIMDESLTETKGHCYKTYAADKNCRGYPEADSPFPASLAEFTKNENPATKNSIISQNSDFQYANICSWDNWDNDNPASMDPDEAEACQCDYKKVEYTNGQIRYYGLKTVSPPNIPTPGESTNPGAKEKTGTFYGWRGFCLEEDPSLIIESRDSGKKACLTWYPIDLIQGEIDIYNNYPQAGYIAAGGREYYCLKSEMLEYRLAGRQSLHGCKGGLTWGTFFTILGVAALGALTGGLLAVEGAVGAAIGIGSGIGAAVGAATGVTIDVLNRPGGKCGDANYRYDTSRCRVWGKRGYCSAFSPGWQKYDGLNWGERKKEICTAIARVADDHNQTKAWTNRIWDVNWSVPYLGYKKGQDISPYGSIVGPGGKPDTWQTDLTELGRLEIYPQSLIRTPAECQNLGGVCDARALCVGTNYYCSNIIRANSPYACGNVFCVEGHTDIRLTDDLNKAPFPRICDQNGTCYNFTYEENIEVGIERLKTLFARSYGIWQWPFNASQCVAKCSGGSNAGVVCKGDYDCWGDIQEDVNDEPVDADGNVTDDSSKFQRKNVVYTCSEEVCTGGTKNGQSCSATGTDEDCKDDSFQDGFCREKEEEIRDDNDNPTGEKVMVKRCRKANGNDLGANHPFRDAICSENSDCEVNGICAKEHGLKACQGDGVLSGKTCTGTGAGTCVANGACNTFSCTESSGNSQCRSLADINKPCGQASAKYTLGQNSWDITGRGTSPTIKMVSFDSEGNPSEGPAGMVVNNQIDTNLGFSDGSGRILVKFYAYNENGNQMPLRRVTYTWDDGNSVSHQGSFKNHKDRCRSNEEAGYNFGDTSDACVEDRGIERPGYFFRDYVYFCNDSNSPGWTATANGCVFEPMVTVEDNWGKTWTEIYKGTITVCSPDNNWSTQESRCVPRVPQ